MKADLLELPFVRRVPESMDFWSVNRTGNWEEDTRRGRLHAKKLIARMQRDSNPTILPSVLKSMVDNRKFDGVETGFAYVLADYLIQSPSLIEPVSELATESVT